MKALKVTLLSGVALLVVGCSTNEPTVNTTKQIVTLENGKQYSVPQGSSYTKAPVTDKVIKRYTELGVKDCQNGDITWETESVASSINKVLRTGSKDEGLAIYRKAAKEGTVGCSSPLSNK
ncbi:MAG: hypothetical protein DRG09_05900 [Epsilonproteobacteria bacterium]|nr:MAG: hypothetical protein DRG09_05900 [Campylobacterota bacterium]